jgi:hypothetical protein
MLVPLPLRLGFATLLVLHGAIHAAGFAKAYGLAALPALSRSIGRGPGLFWLLAGLGCAAAAALVAAGQRGWWLAAAPTLLLSQVLIFTTFHDARLGTTVNLVVLVPVLLAAADLRPSSLRSRYAHDLTRARAAATSVEPARPIAEADLATLPSPVQRYLRRAGVVGTPRVRGFHARLAGQMRTARDTPWMKATIDQYDAFLPGGATRLFFMTASRAGLPFDAFHRYADGTATMQVKVAGLFPVVDAAGPEMTRSETVTLLNDICLLAPGVLLDAPITWRAIDARRAEATYANAGHSVSAILTVDDQGDLTGFLSFGRAQSDGKTSHLYPWSTPVARTAEVDGRRLSVAAEARWLEPAGEWTYGQFTVESIAYDVSGS